MLTRIKAFLEFLWLYSKGFRPVEFVRGDDRLSLHACGWRANGTGRMRRAKDAVAYLDSADREQWRQIYCGMTPFLVSDKGNVKHIDGRPAKLFLSNGRYQVMYKPEDARGRGKNGRDHKKRVYRAMLVAMAFLDFKKGDETHEVHHVNGYRTDDRLANLLVVTHDEHTRIHNMGPCGLSGGRDEALAALAASAPLKPRKAKKKSESAEDETARGKIGARSGRRPALPAPGETCEPAPDAGQDASGAAPAPDAGRATAKTAPDAQGRATDASDTPRQAASGAQARKTGKAEAQEQAAVPSAGENAAAAAHVGSLDAGENAPEGSEAPAPARKRGRRRKRKPSGASSGHDAGAGAETAAATEEGSAEAAQAAPDAPDSNASDTPAGAGLAPAAASGREEAADDAPRSVNPKRKGATQGGAQTAGPAADVAPKAASGTEASSPDGAPFDWERARARLDDELARFLERAVPPSGDFPADDAITKRAKPVYKALKPFLTCPDAITRFDASLSCVRMIARAESEAHASAPGPVQSLLGAAHNLMKTSVKAISGQSELERACLEELLAEEASNPLYEGTSSVRRFKQCRSIACSFHPKDEGNA